VHFAFLISAENFEFFYNHQGGFEKNLFDPSYVLPRFFATKCGCARLIENNFFAFSFVLHQNETTIGCQAF
jgi:hypothetical protein